MKFIAFSTLDIKRWIQKDKNNARIFTETNWMISEVVADHFKKNESSVTGMVDEILKKDASIGEILSALADKLITGVPRLDRDCDNMYVKIIISGFEGATSDGDIKSKREILVDLIELFVFIGNYNFMWASIRDLYFDPED